MRRLKTLEIQKLKRITFSLVILCRWSFIAKKLPGRTDNDVKNFWNTKLRKKLWSMGIDHVTHKPFPQIFSDYGKISGLLITPNQNLNQTVVPELKNLNPTPVLTEHPTSMMLMNMNPILDQDQTNNNLLTSNTNPTWDFLASQFQLMEQETVHPYFQDEVISSSSSTSSSSASSSRTFTQLSSPSSYNFQSSSHQDQTKPSSPFLWNEFLLGEPVESNVQGPLPSSPEPAVNTFKSEISGCNFAGSSTAENGISSTGEKADFASETASSSAISFVESILDRDSKIRPEFPELYDGFFEY